MTASTAPSTAPERAPSVLVIFVVRDAADWLRETLHALAAQDYPRLGVLAIDDASVDGSSEILRHALGEARVLRNATRLGFAGSFALGAAHPAASAADHLFLLHDDVTLDPDSVTRMVEATQIPGTGEVGIVGGKVVAHDDPRRLLDVGRSADRFGHPYTPLQAGEIDQGQFDRVLDVLSVDSSAMLVSRAARERVGLLDERLDDHGDLDLGWRVRVAGFRVFMTPLARVRHREAEELDARPDGSESRRYLEDRAALATALKNYGMLTLAWVLPLYVVLAAFRLIVLALARRFEEASEVVRAFAWNLAHLGGTLKRRRAVQRARRTKDHALRRFTGSAGFRLPRWFRSAERILEEQRELVEEEEGQPASRRWRHRTASLFSAHPVLVTSFLAVLVGAFATRHLVGPEPLAGGALPAFPVSANGFFSELVSGYRTTGLGGTALASPALAGMGGLSYLLLGSTAIAQKLMVAAGPAVAVIVCYRACRRWVGPPGPAALAAACYGLSAVVLWTFSEGRLALALALVAIPLLLERTNAVFSAADPPEGRPRVVAGLAVTIAVSTAFVPGTLLAFALIVAVSVVSGPRRGAGLLAAALAVVGAAVLLFPFVPTIAAEGGAALGALVGEPDPSQLVQLVLGPAPGDWWPAAFLPVAAVLGLMLSRDELRPPARRLAAIALGGTGLAWLAAAGYLPSSVSNPPVYVALAAAAEAVLVAIGLRSIAGGVAQESFGLRQIAAAALTVSLAIGFVSQSVAAMVGGWQVGGADQVTAAWAVVDSTATGHFRVLWVGGASGNSFPAPGGDPVAIVDAGGTVVRYQLTDRSGALAVDTARVLTGPGAPALEATVSDIVSGGSVHAGASLAPFAVRFVVADPDDLPAPLADALEAQVDLDRIPSSELMIWRNAVSLETAVVLTPTEGLREAMRAPGPDGAVSITVGDASRIDPVPGGWAGATQGGTDVVVSTGFDGGWTLDGSDAPPERSFGWGTTFPTTAPAVRVRFGSQLAATVAAWLLAVVWAVALWVTRKPVRT